VQTSTGSTYNQPQNSGDVFLIFSISAKNISSQTQTMSCDIECTLQDKSGLKYDSTYDYDAGTPLDDPLVISDALIKGVIVYEVPASIKTFTLTYQPDIFSNNAYVWNITD
jgi:hypothetical protein